MIYGFAVFEDFDGAQQRNNFESQMRRVLPGGRFVKLDQSHRLFDTLFKMPEYWEWSGQGLFPFDASNEAYKLGVNYMMYGLTH